MNFKHVTSIEVFEPGCSVLYEKLDYEGPPMINVYEGPKLTIRIPAIRIRIILRKGIRKFMQ